MSVKIRLPDRSPARRTKSGPLNPFEVAFQTSRMAMILTDPRRPAHPVVFANEAFARLTGYSRDEIIGNPYELLQGPRTDPQAVAAVAAALAKGEGIETEILSYRKDGTPFWSALAISPVRDEDDTLVYFFALQSDIGDKKLTELKLHEASDRLEERVESRMQELLSAIQRKEALLHEVEHRVKNNLQVISSLVLLKARRIGDEKAQQALYNLAERISALSTVHRLLYPAGDASRFDLGEFVEELSKDLVDILPRGQVELDIQVDAISMPAARAAPVALLLNEIVNNAVKHAFPDRRKGRLAIRIARDGPALAMTIADTGVGFEAASLDHGFGKILIDMLIRQLRGTVAWTDAKPGTRVEVMLPLDMDDMQL